MSCGPCTCHFAAGTCVRHTGTGSRTDPLVPELVIPSGAVVPHPLAPGFLPDTVNGAACTPTGLMAPQPGFVSGSQSDIPLGSLPDIVANQVNSPWGPVLGDSLVNLNADRFDLIWHAVVHPVVTATLEAGASVEYGIILDPNGLAIYLPLWGVSNFSGLATEVYRLLPQTAYNGPGLLAPSGTSLVEYQSYVGTAGFGGASSVTALGQAGLGIRQQGVPL